MTNPERSAALRCVVLDDYQAVAAQMADWVALSPHGELRFVHHPILGYVTERSYRLMFGRVVDAIAAWLAGTPLREIVQEHPARQLVSTPS